MRVLIAPQGYIVLDNIRASVRLLIRRCQLMACGQVSSEFPRCSNPPSALPPNGEGGGSGGITQSLTRRRVGGGAARANWSPHWYVDARRRSAALLRLRSWENYITSMSGFEFPISTDKYVGLHRFGPL